MALDPCAHRAAGEVVPEGSAVVVAEQDEDDHFRVPHRFHQVRPIFFRRRTQTSPRSSSPASKTTSLNTPSAPSSPLLVPSAHSSAPIAPIVHSSTTPTEKPRRKPQSTARVEPLYKVVR